MAAKKVFVIGMGTMGAGIVQACAQAGHHVSATDASPEVMRKGAESIQWSLGKLSDSGRLGEDREAVWSRVELVHDLSAGAESDVVIEAIFEDLATKQELFGKLGPICPEHALFSTNTSSIPITEIASAVSQPDKFVGIHFFNPVHRMKLVEIVRGVATSDETVAEAKAFAVSLGKEVVTVNKDTAGFIVNRINGMAFLEALRLLEKGVASPRDIDKAMRLGLGNPMGPFELMDLVGLDVVLKARMGIYEETRDPTHYPPVTLRRMVQAGQLGRKTKKGFYDY